jgi:DNA-binding MarR family transcriptional regulator
MSLGIRFVPSRKRLETLEKEYSDFKPYYIEVLQALFALSIDLEKSLEMLHTKKGFSRARYLFLMVLLHEDSGRLTPNEIATRLGVTRGNMTGLVDCLLKHGLVKKYQDTEDRRQVWIEMTPKAEAYLKEIMPEHFKRIAKFMSAISREEGEQLIKIARKLHGALDAFKED